MFAESPSYAKDVLSVKRDIIAIFKRPVNIHICEIEICHIWRRETNAPETKKKKKVQRVKDGAIFGVIRIF